MNLVIGNTSQLSYYFPEDYIKISSRNIDFNYLKSNKWSSVYITFAEQRIYDSAIDYITPNYLNTLQIINSLLENSNKIVCFSSCELFSNLFGAINLNTEPCFNLNNEYTISKLLLINKIKELRKINTAYEKIIFMYPFYFNSVRRSTYFLFGKIFDSIINKKKIEVGNLNFMRDMVHAKFVVEKSIEASSDLMIGCGKLINVKYFIDDLFKLNNMDINDYVKSINSEIITPTKNITADVKWSYTYQNLLEDTMEDLKKVIK